ncbi:MAG: alpha/beta fold hydrolase [Candidatus Babeliales bacterium]
MNRFFKLGINKKGTAVFVAFLFITVAIKTSEFRSCGKIVATCKDRPIKGAKLEKVRLYVHKNRESDEYIERKGFLIRYDGAIGTVLICHGFMSDKYDGGFFRCIFPSGKYNIMSFDFRAHGENCEGQYCTFGRDEALDVLSAAHFLKNHPFLQGKPLFAYGFSMGAVALIEAQARDHTLFNGMILDCPFDSSENIIKRGLEKIKFSFFGYQFSLPGVKMLQRYAFHPYVQSFVKYVLKVFTHFDACNVMISLCPLFPVKSVERIRIPSLFIHCKNDEKVSVEAIQSLFDRSSAVYKKLWITGGRRHFDSFFYKQEEYLKTIEHFLDVVQSGQDLALKDNEVIVDEDEL